MTTHDTELDRYIGAARERFETDTEYVCLTQTYTYKVQSFPGGSYLSEDSSIYLPVRPLQSVTSITYYDEDNAQQTLATTVYGVDTAKRRVYLKYDQEWPSITEQYNGIVVTFVVGYGTASNVPDIFKRIILEDVAHQFFERHAGDHPGTKNFWQWRENLIAPYKRETYP